MREIQVTFDDGTTELRPANSPCLLFGSILPGQVVTPADFAHTEMVDACPEPLVFFYRLASDRGTHRLEACPDRKVLVWRITGGASEEETLTGEWQWCDVESSHEQIVRLTAERDALVARVQEWWPIVHRMECLQGYAYTAHKVATTLGGERNMVRARVYAHVLRYLEAPKGEDR